jgi:hypothetical protein
MTEHKTHNNKEYACVDKDAEPIDNDSTDLNGALIDLLIKTRVLVQWHTRIEITTHNYVSDAYSI